jgi:hypothetical protein
MWVSCSKAVIEPNNSTGSQDTQTCVQVRKSLFAVPQATSRDQDALQHVVWGYLVLCLQSNLDPEPVLSPPTPTRCHGHPRAAAKARTSMTRTSPRQAPSRRTRTRQRCLHLSYHLQHALAHLYYLPKVFVRCNTLIPLLTSLTFSRRVLVASALRSY